MALSNKSKKDFWVKKMIASPSIKYRIGLVHIFGASLLISACGGGGTQDPDPVLVDNPVAYVKRPIPLDLLDADNDNNVDEIRPESVLQPSAFNPGAALYIRDRAAPGAREINITDDQWPMGELYDVKDVEVSSDGTQLVFAMRAPDDPTINDPFDQAKWDIWIYTITTDQLQPLLPTAEAQIGNDVAPHFLPGNDVVVFSSDRQTNSRQVRLFEGKPGFSTIHEDAGGNDPDYAFNLHTAEIASQTIKQITFNQSHDLQPTVLQDGRVMFLRWDNYRSSNRTNLSLYTIHPDGSNLQFYYGFHSQDTGTNGGLGVFTQPRELENGNIMVNLKPRVDERFGGDIVIIDGESYTEIDQATALSGGAGPGQASGSLLDVSFYDFNDLADPADLDDPNRIISTHGRFNSIYPLNDGTGRMLVSWNQCRLIDPLDPDQLNPTQFLPCTDENLTPDPMTPAVLPHEAPPLYGVWIYDVVGGTQLPVFAPEEGIVYSDIVAMAPQTPATVIPSLELTADPNLRNAGVGVVHIRSVYDFDGNDAFGIASLSDPSSVNYANRPARFLRLIKAVGRPDEDVLDLNGQAIFGQADPAIMREILGYVPVEPDGSAKFQIPADMAVTFTVLDANGHRLPQFPLHRVWLQVAAGEELECNGCHTAGSEQPHGRFDAEAISANPGSAGGGAFPGAQPTITAAMGETMAEALANNVGNAAIPSVNLEYRDPWALSPPADISILMSDLTTTSPVTPAIPCEATWDSLCRIIINYEDHIQPIWDFGRTDASNNDITCINCHNRSDLADLDNDPMTNILVPAGQLELTSDLGDNALNTNADPNGFFSISYRDLLTPGDEFGDYDNNGTLELREIETQPEIQDGMGNIIQQRETRGSQCNPTMDAGSALNSSNPRVSNTDCEVATSPQDFFDWFTPGAPHEDYLTPAELKLISEWLDIGAQYHNNLNTAPVN